MLIDFISTVEPVLNWTPLLSNNGGVTVTALMQIQSTSVVEIPNWTGEHPKYLLLEFQLSQKL